MNNNFDTSYIPLSEETYLSIDYEDPIITTESIAPVNIDKISNEIERLRARYQTTPDQFFSGLATKISPDRINILVPELKSLVDKIFLVLDATPNVSVVKEITNLARYLLSIYENEDFDFNENHLIENIAALFKKYLDDYFKLNSSRFRGYVNGFQGGLVSQPAKNHIVLEFTDQLSFYFASETIVESFKNLLQAISGENFFQKIRRYITWNNSLTEIVEKWKRGLDFDTDTFRKNTILCHFSSECYISWVDNSENYVFNDFLIATFMRYFFQCPNLWVYLLHICDSLKTAEKWVKKGKSPQELLSLVTIMNIFSTTDFSASQRDFDCFFISLLRCHAWLVFQQCVETFPEAVPPKGTDFFESAEVRKKIENCAGSLTDTEIDFLNFEFEKYGKIVEYFKNLIYKDGSSTFEQILVLSNKFSNFLNFILMVFSNIQEQNNYGDWFQLMSSENSFSYFFP